MSACACNPNGPCLEHHIERIRAEAKAEGAAEERTESLKIVRAEEVSCLERKDMQGAAAAWRAYFAIRARGPNVAPKDEAREKALEALKRVRHRPDSLSGSVCHCPDCDVIDEAIALLSK